MARRSAMSWWVGSPASAAAAWAWVTRCPRAVRGGIDWLIATQQTDGNWNEEPFTGTGFPKVFYLKYHLYSLYFPLMALARYSSALSHERVLPFAPPHAQPHAQPHTQSAASNGYYTAGR